jgi:hypothetical protein
LKTDNGRDEAQAALEARGLTDGLPVVPPTRERVEAMLGGRTPDKVVCNLAPMLAPATWRDIAICAVMAGCKPEYLPIVAAALEAMAAPEFNLTGISTTTGSAAPLVIVNGPIAARIGMNAAANALGPGNRANATIGRAVSLCLRNIGGATPGEVDMATLGQPAKYSCCFAENEAQSPWVPLHVERGFAREDSVVTVVGIGGTTEVVDSASSKGEDLAQTFAQSMLIAGTVGGAALLGGGEPLVIVPPELAATCQRDGYTKEKFKAAIFERAVMPLDRLPPTLRAHRSGQGDGIAASDGVLRVARRAEDVMIVVAGGVGVKAAYAPTWGGGTRAVSRKVLAQ